jgi:hypothetical protein
MTIPAYFNKYENLAFIRDDDGLTGEAFMDQIGGEELQTDTSCQVEDGLPRGGMDKADQVAPGVAVLGRCNRSPAAPLAAKPTAVNQWSNCQQRRLVG